MPIEFSCSACQTKVRTPDDSTGKMARCPKCGATLQIPAAAPAPPGFSPPSLPSGFDPTASRPSPSSIPPLKPPPSNPFSDAPVNSYAAPAHIQFGAASSLRDYARSRLLGPAIGFLITAVIGAGFLVMAMIGLSIDRGAMPVPNDPAEQAGFYGALVAIFVGGFLVHVLQILAAISMLRVRGRALAQIGTYASFFPCNFYCCWLGLPFAIWGAIVLANPQVRAGLEQP